MLIDTHCHIHESDYPLDSEQTLKRAHDNGVDQVICIGTSVQGSRDAIDFANKHDGVYATIGIHPEYAADGLGDLESLIDKNNPKIVAIGEIGLDYHSSDVTPSEQIKLLKQQIKLALKYDLPVVFHVRDAYDDFWPIFDSFSGIRGELHCFSDTMENAQKGIDRGLYIGINGISTFTKDETQKEMFKNLPLDKLVLETDAPYLTPAPFRGKVNEPAFVRNVAVFGGTSRHISEDRITSVTSENAKALFRL